MFVDDLSLESIIREYIASILNTLHGCKSQHACFVERTCKRVYWKGPLTIFSNDCFSLQELGSAKTEIKRAQAKAAIKSFVEVINFTEEPMWVVLQSTFCETDCIFFIFSALSGMFHPFFLKTHSLSWLFLFSGFDLLRCSSVVQVSAQVLLQSLRWGGRRWRRRRRQGN